MTSPGSSRRLVIGATTSSSAPTTGCSTSTAIHGATPSWRMPGRRGRACGRLGCDLVTLPRDVLISEARSREIDGLWLVEPGQFLTTLCRARAPISIAFLHRIALRYLERQWRPSQAQDAARSGKKKLSGCQGRRAHAQSGAGRGRTAVATGPGRDGDDRRAVLPVAGDGRGGLRRAGRGSASASGRSGRSGLFVGPREGGLGRSAPRSASRTRARGSRSLT